MMKIKKVVVAGGGVLGSQIAFQAAYSGFDVCIWLRSESSISRTQPKLEEVRKSYESAIEAMKKDTTEWAAGIADIEDFDAKKCLKKVDEAYRSIKLELDIKKALDDADIIIESVAEKKEDKIKFYKMIAPLIDKKTLVATNSSTLLPSNFAKHTGCPERYLAMHFANSIWKNNIVEVMAQEKTGEKYFNLAVDFAKEIHMLPLPINKEKSGYLLNSMLVPFLLSGLDLYVNGISDPKSIDSAWKRGTGAPRGPFEIMDIVGLQTAYNIVDQYQKVPGMLNPLLKKMMLPYNYKNMKKVLKEYLDDGKFGKQSGEGFYKY